MKILNKIKGFIKNPKNIRQEKSLQNFKQIVLEFVVYDFFVILIFMILNTFFLLFIDEYKAVFHNRNTSSNQFFDRWLIVIIVAPIIEEIIFRLGLKINRLTLSISLGFHLILSIQLTNLTELSFFNKIWLSVCTSLLFLIIVNNKIIKIFKSNNNLFIYYNIIMFGLVHCLNYNYNNFSNYVFIPVLIFPQLMLGVFLSYSRLKHSFALSLLLHIFHNSFLHLLKTLMY